MRWLFVVALLTLAGCGPIQVNPDSGRFPTIQHGTARFNDAMAAVRKYCAGQGLGVRHLRTDTPPQGLSISSFECVKPE